MTTILQGATVTLVFEARQYAGGPAVDLTGVTVGIKTADGVTTVLAPTSTGVTHPGTGVYSYAWTVPGAQAPGEYLITWSGTLGPDTVTATEVVTVAAVPTYPSALTAARRYDRVPYRAEDAAGAPIPGAQGTVWDAPTGGTQLTTITTLAGAPIPGGLLTADSSGYFPGFLDPSKAASLYIIGSATGTIAGVDRVHIEPSDTDDRIIAVEAYLLGTGGITSRLDAADAARGAAGGLATLDLTGKVPAAQLPAIKTSNLLTTVADLPTPYYVGHRGAGAHQAPENSPEALHLGAAEPGVHISEFDVWTGPDGSFPIIHDTTVDRTTTGSGNVSDFDGPAFGRLKVDAVAWFAGGQGDTRTLFLDEVLDTWGGRHLLMPHTHGTADTQAVVDMATARGIKDAMIVQTFVRADADLAAAAGMHTQLLIASEAAATANPPSSLIASKIERVSFDQTAISDATITSYVNAGLIVCCYGVNRQYRRAQLTALGVTGIDGDQPVYVAGDVSRYRRTSDPWVTQTYGHGHLTNLMTSDSVSATERGSFNTGDRWGMPAGTSKMFLLLGWACPLAAPTAYQLDIKVRWDATGTSSTRWAGIHFSSVRDHPYDDSGSTLNSGYTLLLRQNGNFELYAKDNTGGATQLGSTVVTAALTATIVAQLRVQVTATTVTVTRTDIASPNSISVTNNAYRGGYIFVGREGTGGGPGLSFYDAVIT